MGDGAGELGRGETLQKSLMSGEAAVDEQGRGGRGGNTTEAESGKTRDRQLPCGSVRERLRGSLMIPF
jgi:hypothetical protein